MTETMVLTEGSLFPQVGDFYFTEGDTYVVVNVIVNPLPQEEQSPLSGEQYEVIVQYETIG